ncbi:MAG: hypothetical protein ABL994_15345, partial [Verrucomicrobiales bacterium]
MTGSLIIANEGSDPALEVVGIASGRTLLASRSLISSGTLLVTGASALQGVTATVIAATSVTADTVTANNTLASSGNLVIAQGAVIRGTMSGNTIEGFNLTDCDLATSKLLWDATNKTFSCATDQDNGTTYTAGTGLTLLGSEFFVSNSGITALQIADDTIKNADISATANIAFSKLNITKADIEGLGIPGSDTDTTYTAGNGLNLNGTTFSIASFLSGGTLHFDDVHARNRLTSSGTLAVDSLARFKSNVLVSGSLTGAHLVATSTFAGAGLSDCDLSTSKLLWDSQTNTFSCGTDQSSGGDLTVGDGDIRYVNRGGDTMTGTLAINLASGTLGLNVKQTASASTLFANAALRSSGTLTVEGTTVLQDDLTVQGDLTTNQSQGVAFIDSLGRLLTNTTSFFWDNTLGRLGIGTSTPETALEVVGTISGSTLHATDTLSSSGNLVIAQGAVIRGTLSGNTIEGFNLSDCDLATSKLLWDATNKTFSCGTDTDTDTTYSAGQAISLSGTTFSLAQQGASSGQVLKWNGSGWTPSTDRNDINAFSTGNVLTISDPRYVNVSGDTMTGSLIIANEGSDPALEVVGIASGRTLLAS